MLIPKKIDTFYLILERKRKERKKAIEVGGGVRESDKY